MRRGRARGQPPLKVLYIAGCGRSGSTLLGNLLGQLDGFCALGEVPHLWDRSLRDNRLCGCGRPFAECRLWQPVLARALGRWTREELAETIAVRERLTAWRILARSFRGSGGRRSPAFGRYVERVGRIYREVARVTGSRVLVDGSKSPGHAEVLRQIPGLEVCPLLLVRDPRAVAFAWQKRQAYDPDREQPMAMGRLDLRQSAIMWVGWNLATERMWRRRPGGCPVLRYEDFVARPRASVERILALLDASRQPLPFIDEHTVELAPQHALAGNPCRFDRGPVEIRRDDAWRRQMPRHRQLAVAALTWPWRRRYGYRLGRRSTASER